ncbi:amino acid ABC transporter permease [Arcanobacterium haemolyticum]|uniref:Polar amino acid ABC transporter, inner membrane subunit n=1 Tax=Arcanobacterium haemolyticum (strain ATCC 9345 / DSM 20595 / CCM 5947 / CCUG 17215 / LMG 16163 / NBRC 15585 / NCTC 8452 / 11018) TaxID=644284 RepID=D7BLT9_ARCHD|nr:amino acid ABC transporter permease [Arcanobacterium haemolyticum]ADH91888.1 polar amino acid ABC transporter, inner membrane subunit [Arcanobacterium haemolyticum DSM 20595]QCX46072.1 amino acid ABC transporter permease [Arcanobacterium haemolyticum]SPT75545.1 Inner membrane amino-acid ABC transporter permease protein yecS [Arcanobacterium haemolyticum]SQH27058.1 Inner membrane amino-acid ABC transporter permease protein yecS [Arcanobacterium haemolyticum]
MPENSSPELIHAVPVRHWGRWISAAVVAVIAYAILNQLIVNPQFQWDVVWANLFKIQIVKAVGWTLALTVAAMVLGIILAVTMAIMRRSENPVLRSVATAYIWFFRGTPIYTQLIFWGLIGTLFPTITVGIPGVIDFFTFAPNTIFAERQYTMFLFAVLGLGLNEGAYLAEIVRSGLNSVDPGQEEAAKALGMSNGMILRRIVLPQAMRVIVPPTGNETISMLKTTSLVTAVPLSLELTHVTNASGFSSFKPIPFLIVAAIWYLVITSVLMVGQYYLEKFYGRGAGSGAQTPNARGKKARAGRQAAINASRTTTDDPFAEYTP